MKKGVKDQPKKSDAILMLKTELDTVKNYIKNDVSLPVVASFGFIIALVWRDAIRATLDEFLERAGVLEEVYIYEIVSALIVTFLIVVLMVAVTEFSRARRTKKIGKEVERVRKKLGRSNESSDKKK